MKNKKQSNKTKQKINHSPNEGKQKTNKKQRTTANITSNLKTQ